MSSKILIISCVINCFIQILCIDSTTNKLIDDIEKWGDAKLVEVIDNNFTSLETTLENDDYFKCNCDLGEECTNCLDDDQRSFETMFLLTASEVILGTAIILGLSAVVTVLLRVCSSSRLTQNGQNVSNVPNEFNRNGFRVSLTSLQQRVMSKLRDRPPRYETRHNYEYQRREQTRRISVLNPRAIPISPPPYQLNDAEPNSESSSIHSLPPAYSITTTENTGGIRNQSFENDENPTRLESEPGISSLSNESDIKTRSGSSNNILHI